MNSEKIKKVDDIELELEKQQVQEIIRLRGILENDYILVPIEYAEGLKEYLWFRVEDLSEGKVMGRLSNEPVYAHLKIGDVRWIRLEEIAGIGEFTNDKPNKEE